MRFNIFVAIASLVLSVNAIDLAGQDFKESVVNCFKDISATSKKFTIFANAIYSFQESSEYDDIHYQEQVLETYLNSAITSCCTPTDDPISDEEGKTGFIILSDYTTKSIFALLVAESKQAAFDSNPSNSARLYADLKRLDTQNDALATCLKSRSPAKDLSTTATLNATLSDEFDRAKKMFAPLFQI